MNSSIDIFVVEFIENSIVGLTMMACACNPSTWKAGASGCTVRPYLKQQQQNKTAKQKWNQSSVVYLSTPAFQNGHFLHGVYGSHPLVCSPAATLFSVNGPMRFQRLKSESQHHPCHLPMPYSLCLVNTSPPCNVSIPSTSAYYFPHLVNVITSYSCWTHFCCFPFCSSYCNQNKYLICLFDGE